MPLNARCELCVHRTPWSLIANRMIALLLIRSSVDEFIPTNIFNLLPIRKQLKMPNTCCSPIRLPMPVVLGLHDEPPHTGRTPCSACAVLELQRHQVPLGAAERPRPLPAQPTQPAAGLHHLRQRRDRPGRTVRLRIVRELRENGRMLRPDHLPSATGS